MLRYGHGEETLRMNRAVFHPGGGLCRCDAGGDVWMAADADQPFYSMHWQDRMICMDSVAAIVYFTVG